MPAAQLPHLVLPEFTLATAHQMLRESGHTLAIITDPQQGALGIAHIDVLTHAIALGHQAFDPAIHTWPLPDRRHPTRIIDHHWRVHLTHDGLYQRIPAPPQPCDTISWERIHALLEARSIPILHDIVASAEVHGAQIYLVGGAARSIFDGLPVHDIDLAITGPVRPVVQHIATTLGGRVEQHDAFSTASIIFDPEQQQRWGLERLDLVPTRTEHYAHQGALPSTEPCDIVTDAGRRDISVNAIAIALTHADDCAIYDPYAGRHALKQRRVALLHPLSICDDPTRVVRIARLAARLGLRVSTHMQRVMHAAATHHAFAHVSPQRWHQEINKALAEADPWPIINRLHRWRLWSFIHPVFAKARAAHRHIQQVAPAYRLQALLWGTPVAQLQDFGRDWPQLTVSINQLITLTNLLYQPTTSTGALTVHCKPFTTELLSAIALMDSHVAPLLNSVIHARTYAAPLRINGHDLHRIGMPKGPQMRIVLTALETALYDGELAQSTPEQQLAWVCQHFPAWCTPPTS